MHIKGPKAYHRLFEVSVGCVKRYEKDLESAEGQRDGCPDAPVVNFNVIFVIIRVTLYFQAAMLSL